MSPFLLASLYAAIFLIASVDGGVPQRMTLLEAELRTLERKDEKQQIQIRTLEQKTCDLRGDVEDEIMELKDELDTAENNIKALRADMENENEALRADIESKNEALRADMENKTQALREDMANEHQALRGDMANEHQALRGDMANEHQALREDVANEHKALREDMDNKTQALREDIGKQINETQKDVDSHESRLKVLEALNDVFCLNDTYQTLDEPWRASGEVTIDQENCDNTKSGWYRFKTNSANAVLTTTCVQAYGRCGSSIALWLSLDANQTMPNPGEEVEGSGCGFAVACCRFQTGKIRVKNCGSYFIYHLQKYNQCSLGYCTEMQ